MSKFSRECCKEFKGWCKSFTRSETLLAILEAFLLILFLVFLVFLIVHLISCKGIPTSEPSTTQPYNESDDQTTTPRSTAETTTIYDAENKTTSRTDHTKPTTKTAKTTPGSTFWSTRCTAVYPNETLKDQATTHSTRCTADYNATKEVLEDYSAGTEPPDTDDPETESDGELATDEDRDMVLALVKIKPSGVTFGCILTVLSDHWTVTAASCLDSIEEVDSLDSFVITDNYGEAGEGRAHPVTDVRVHPLYEGGNRSYDLALLKADEPLGRRAALLPTMVDYFKITIGEKFDILGFGKFRSIDTSPAGKRVHVTSVHALPARHCAPAELAARHLRPLGAVAHARCGAAPLCAGVLRARARPCNYCAGAPLLRGPPEARLLLGVMADNDACGSACDAAFYANAARLTAWIRDVVDNK